MRQPRTGPPLAEMLRIDNPNDANDYTDDTN